MTEAHIKVYFIHSWFRQPSWDWRVPTYPASKGMRRCFHGAFFLAYGELVLKPSRFSFSFRFWRGHTAVAPPRLSEYVYGLCEGESSGSPPFSVSG
jgi:hypothetical protein